MDTGDRRTKIVTIDDKGSRDYGKHYLITEMDAFRGEWFAIRVGLLLAQSGVELGEATGFQALAIAGIMSLTKIKPEELKPLLDEMLGCVQVIPDLNYPNNRRPVGMMLAGDITEVSTLFKLRLEIFELHTGFSVPGAPSGQLQEASGQTSSNMQTSRP